MPKINQIAIRMSFLQKRGSYLLLFTTSFILILCLVTSVVSAQDFKTEMSKINECIKLGNWRMSSSVIALETGNVVPLDKQVGESILFGKHYYSKLGHIESIVTPTEVLYIDHLKKTIDYFSTPLKIQSPFASMEAFMDYQDSWFEKKIYKEVGKGLVQYDLWPYPGHEYARLAITYEKGSHWMRKLEMWYPQGQGEIETPKGTKHCDKMELNFGAPSHPKTFPEELKIANYVNCQNNKCTPVGKLKEYEVIIRN